MLLVLIATECRRRDLPLRAVQHLGKNNNYFFRMVVLIVFLHEKGSGQPAARAPSDASAAVPPMALR